MPAPSERPAPAPSLGVIHGSAVYVGALVGPGLLLVPALAVQAAGPASVLAWSALLVLSAPLAATFAALGARYPVAGGVSAYARAGLGATAAAVTGTWFVAAVTIGAPAVSLIGGLYVTALIGGGTSTAALVGLAMFAACLLANALGVRVSTAVQMALSTLLVVVLTVAVAVALPTRGGEHWTPFAPHGWWAVGTAASLLIWQFVGWEAVAQLAGEFREPSRDLPRAAALAFAIVTVLYISLAVATVGVSGGSHSSVPLADLVSVGFGRAGRDATAGLALALTMGTMNVYLGSAARLAGALAVEGALPRALRPSRAGVPLRALALTAAIGLPLLGLLALGAGSAAGLVRATSALFVGVYVLAVISATRLLTGRARTLARAALVPVALVAGFSGWYLLVPAGVAVIPLARGGLSRLRPGDPYRLSSGEIQADPATRACGGSLD